MLGTSICGYVCARMESDVLNDVEDGVFSIILYLNHPVSAYGMDTSSHRIGCCVLGRIVIAAE
jgi:hypothetical protein